MLAGKITQRLDHLLWSKQYYSQANLWQRYLLDVSRLLIRLGRDIAEGYVNLQAMSLVFSTLIAIVPLLAVSFSVLKGFGVHNQIEPFLLNFLQQPFGAVKGAELTNNIITFVENIKVGVLGSLGLAMLFYSAIAMVQKIERAFNSIWRLRQSRSIIRRFSDYLSVLIIGPVLVFTALAVSASLLNHSLVQSLLSIEPLGYLFRFIVRFLPYFLIILAFSFFYMFIPNTRVKFKAALIGGAVSGVIWQSASWLFASFVVASTNYTAIYSGLAVLMLFIIWLYLNWLILLIGASLVFYIQYPENVLPQKTLMQDIASQEKLGLMILSLISKRFYNKEQGISADQLASSLSCPSQHISRMLDTLMRSQLINETADSQPKYIPAAPFEITTVAEALRLIRGDNKADDSFASLEAVLQAAYSRRDQYLSEITLKDLAQQHGPQ